MANNRYVDWPVAGQNNRFTSFPLTAEAAAAAGLQTVDLALSAATLSSGANLADASGALPQRITTEKTYVLQPSPGVIGAGLLFGNDDRTIITAVSGRVRKFDFSGSLIWDTGATLGGGTQIARINTNLISAGRTTAATTALSFITESSGQASVRAVYGGAGFAPRQSITVPGGANPTRLWAMNAATQSFEHEFGSSTATRALVFPGTLRCAWATSGSYDGIPSIYALAVSGAVSWVIRYKESDLTEIGRWVPGGVVNNEPGFNFGVNLYVPENLDESGSFWVRSSDDYDRIRAGASASATVPGTLAERIMYGGRDIMGPSTVAATTPMPSVAKSPDGRYVAYYIADRAMTTLDSEVAIKNVTTQRARWVWTMSAGTLQKIVIPGYLGNSYGVLGLSGSVGGDLEDFRKGRCYYQRATGDAARVEFTPGATLNVALIAGQTLTIDVDFQHRLGMTYDPDPYVSDGVQVQYT